MGRILVLLKGHLASVLAIRPERGEHCLVARLHLCTEPADDIGVGGGVRIPQRGRGSLLILEIRPGVLVLVEKQLYPSDTQIMNPPASASNVNERSHPQDTSLPLIMYAAFGMDRYNSHLYLRKFTSAQLQEISDAFKRSSSVVDAALAESLRNDRLLLGYRPLHPELSSLAADDFVDASLRGALSKASPGRLIRLMREEAPDVYSFPLFSAHVCTLLLEEVEHFKQYQGVPNENLVHPTESKVGMSAAKREAGYTILDDVGLSQMLDELLRRLMVPLARLLYTEKGKDGAGRFAELDWRHGYVISYSDPEGKHGSRSRLSAHTDDSELTLNICLGHEFDGGHLTFGGQRGSAAAAQAALGGGRGSENRSGSNGSDSASGSGLVAPSIGRAIVHMGQQLHRVHDVTAGERHMLIMWCRSRSYRGVTCPCCTINCRGDGCVCNPQWRGRYVRAPPSGQQGGAGGA